ncbi:unannotated protein [freshwater metagenome]|uniref:Unannotated protein n=1 Tax=freshwater metagenome TaxID=449393 RepID=A0A6J7PWG8_9ZZZZ|nr:hypothetical protein [Actinomycetota bacterium]MSY97276.1 hypothetical protein [Actinomycetota bacterium]
MLKRLVIALLGILCLIVGAAGLISGAWIYTVFGSDGEVSAPAGSVVEVQGSNAVVIDLADANLSVPYLTFKGETTIQAKNTVGEMGAALFLGVGEATVIDEYLAQTTYSVGEFTAPTKPWKMTLVPGPANTPGAPFGQPAEKLIWSSSAIGDPAVLQLDSPAAPLTLVVMRSDALSPVAADLSVHLKVPQLVITMWIALAVAVLLLPAALTLFWIALFHLRKRGRHEG